MNCLAQLLQLTDDLSHPVSSDFSPLLFLLFINGPEATVRTTESERDRIMEEFDFELVCVRVHFTKCKSLCKEIRFSLPSCYLFTLLMLVSENCPSVDQLVPKAFFFFSQCEACKLYVLKQG